MDCHILPMVYLDDWSTDETKGLEREKRKIYYFTKSSKYGVCKTTKYIKVDTVSRKDLYILDNHRNNMIIENGFDEKVENKFKDSLKRIDINSNRVNNIDTIIRFITIQLFRQPELMSEVIKVSTDFADLLLGIDNTMYPEINKNKKQLSLLCDFFERESETVIKRTEDNFKCKYSKCIIVASKNIEFITSDSPVTKFAFFDKKIIFMALDRKRSIFLLRENDGYKGKNNARVVHVTDSLVKYINNIIFKSCKKAVFYKERKIRDLLSMECPREELLALTENKPTINIR